MTQDRKIIPVILCGGNGTRLWPLSREDTPKQFLRLGGNNSLLVDTVDRAIKCSGAAADDVVIVTLDSLRRKTIHELSDYDPRAAARIIGEPLARNTAAAVATAAYYVAGQFGPDALLWILPADHYVAAPAQLTYALDDARPVAADGHIVTFGIRPDRAETGYGYIRKGAALHGSDHIFAIDSFVEKPDSDTAATYVSGGVHMWNSGMFLSSARTLIDEFLTYAPAIAQPIGATFAHHPDILHPPADVYAALPSLPFDTVIMEKTARGAMVSCNIGWSDIGSWESLWNLRDKDARGNSVSGRAAVMESRNCLVQASSLLVAAIGLDDLAIVENGDTILVADKKNPDAMRTLIAALNQAGPHGKPRAAVIETLGGGSQRVLSESPGYRVLEITIAPGGRMDTHYHLKRCEFWTVISGTGRAFIGDAMTNVGPQQNCFIPIGTPHSMHNDGSTDLVMVEVQCGISLDNDDLLPAAIANDTGAGVAA